MTEIGFAGWDVIARRFAFGLGVIGLGYLYGTLRDDVDEERLRPWVRRIRQHDRLRQAFSGMLIAISGTALDIYLYNILLPRFEADPVLGGVTVFFGLIAAGAGPPLGMWLAFGDYNPVSQPE